MFANSLTPYCTSILLRTRFEVLDGEEAHVSGLVTCRLLVSLGKNCVLSIGGYT